MLCCGNLNLDSLHNLNAWRRAQTNIYYVSNIVFALLSKSYSSVKHNHVSDTVEIGFSIVPLPKWPCNSLLYLMFRKISILLSGLPLTMGPSVLGACHPIPLENVAKRKRLWRIFHDFQAIDLISRSHFKGIIDLTGHIKHISWSSWSSNVCPTLILAAILREVWRVRFGSPCVCSCVHNRYYSRQE